MLHGLNLLVYYFEVFFVNFDVSSEPAALLCLGIGRWVTDCLVGQRRIRNRFLCIDVFWLTNWLWSTFPYHLDTNPLSQFDKTSSYHVRYEEGGKGNYPRGDVEDDNDRNPFQNDDNDDDDSWSDGFSFTFGFGREDHDRTVRTHVSSKQNRSIRYGSHIYSRDQQRKLVMLLTECRHLQYRIHPSGIRNIVSPVFPMSLR